MGHWWIFFFFLGGGEGGERENVINPKWFQKFYSTSIKVTCCDLCLQKKMFFVVFIYESDVALLTYLSAGNEIFCISQFCSKIHILPTKFLFFGYSGIFHIWFFIIIFFSHWKLLSLHLWEMREFCRRESDLRSHLKEEEEDNGVRLRSRWDREMQRK